IFEGFTLGIEGARAAASDFAANVGKNFREVGKSMFNSIGNAAGQAFSSFGKALVSGEDALQSFIDSLLASMGQMAVQLGTQFMLQGVAMMWAGLPNGGPLIAAGAALATFGGILAALGGKSGGGVSSSGGGVSNSSTDNKTTETVAPNDLERKKPDTYVNVNINGDVLDSDESGMRIIDLINTAYDKNGVKIQNAAVA
ncbi:MAG: hypothetical protein J7501_09150, partial [Bdellovibrio sp.]|nr:hypothetical protein [Bdellovibrio sp.]